jgi:hypothetical protein
MAASHGGIEEDCVDVVFHDVAYNLSITVDHGAVPEPLLAIDLEDLATGA